MKNPRITKKERALIKGKINQVFSRSELRRRVLDASLVKDYNDPNRKRVTRWSRCAGCGKLEPSYLIDIDHIEPKVPVDRSFDDMSLDEYVERAWCDERLLQPLCSQCHDTKSALENSQRPKPVRKKKAKK